MAATSSRRSDLSREDNMDFTIPEDVEATRAKIATFVEREILPQEERQEAFDKHGNIELELLGQLRAKAKAEGLWCLQLPKSDGSFHGTKGMAVCYEEMNRSIFGPVVFNSAAPDDGNIM